jgi:two-component system, sensor histidine kinase and response regulator
MQLLLNTLLFQKKIKSIGYLTGMDEYERRKLGIFNVLNVIGFMIGIFIPISGMFVADINLSPFAWGVTFSPAMVSITVLICNYYKRHELGALTYFIMYPILTAIVYRVSFDVGIELFFILYGVLSVFFLQNILYIAFSLALTLSCYFYFFVYTRDYTEFLVDINFPLYMLNHILPAGFIFYALLLIKKENTQYQLNILTKNRELHRVNLEIKKQKEVINEKARLLEEKNAVIDEKAKLLQKQTSELTALNTMKNKLFSVISHDLKAPLYALRNLFKTMHQYDVPGEDVKLHIPEVIKDLNHTTALTENLLSWVKSQMQINSTQQQLLEISEIVKECTDLLRLQAQLKAINIATEIPDKCYIYSDKDMISLVVRNLLSNAIKFTGAGGHILVGAIDNPSHVEIFVMDNGVGMDSATLTRLFKNEFYSSKGTANETGTGLGLLLCNEFLAKNNGSMFVSSEPGKGSMFSFIILKQDGNAVSASPLSPTG